MALFDTAHENLYVACTGDSRAVAGVWEEDADGTGHWRVDVLTEDQTGRNPNELKRCVMFPNAIALSQGSLEIRIIGFSQSTQPTSGTLSSCADAF